MVPEDDAPGSARQTTQHLGRQGSIFYKQGRTFHRRTKQLGIAFLISIFCSAFFGGLGIGGVNQAQAIDDPGFSGHWAEPCIQSLVAQNVFDQGTVTRRFPNSSLTQAEFADAVLKAFPGAFAAANEELGLTFEEARTETEALLMAAIGEDAQLEQYVGRAQALAILTSGSATPYQADATRALAFTFRDSLLIPKSAREGVAAALAAGYIVDTENASPVDGLRQLRARRSTTIADGASFICRASLDSRIAATVPESQVVPFTPPAQVIAPFRELRGVWMTNIDSEVLFSRGALEKGLNQLADLNFNTVYPTVWNWGYTLFPSAVAERVTGFKQGLYPDLGRTGRQEAKEAAQGDRDMLKELIEIAHSRDLKVIPWFEFGFMAPADSALAQRHPDWLTQKADGTLTTPEGDHQRVWLNPFHPEVQTFIKSLVAELAANYDLDGFQVDDHMGLPVAYGYDPYTINLYKLEHDGQGPPLNMKDPEWTRWRADKITDVIGDIFNTLKSQKADAVMSVSPNPHEWAYEYYLQDWDTWLKRGYVEELIIQLYRNDLGRFVWEMGAEAAEFARTHIPTSIGVLSGLKGRSVPMSQIAEQVEAVRDRNFSGVSFFFYETLWDLSSDGSPAERQAAFQEIFPNQASYPEGRP
ncbi:MAG: glycoside hydrolase family 10 protein [Cyanobacteria bacterium P01_F01_bin.53]